MSLLTTHRDITANTSSSPRGESQRRVVPAITGRQLCQTQKQKEKANDNRGAVLCKVELSADGKAPDWLMLFPAPDSAGKIICRDGRVFSMQNQAALCAAFNAEQHPIPFDVNHATEIQGRWGGEAPAVGWIEELQERGGAIWCRVEWTSEGRELVESKKYRYVSPAFDITITITNSIETRSIDMPVSAGLTNSPAMVMPSLTNKQPEGSKMNKELLKKLGLGEDATQAQIDEAVQKMADKVVAEEAAKNEAAAATAKLKAELAAAQAAQPSLAAFVPRADFDASVARTAALEKAAAESAALAHKTQVDAEIDAALKAGKITHGTKDFYVQTCSTPAGLAAFRDFAAKASTIAPDDVTPVTAPAGSQGGEVVLTSSDLEVIRVKGMSKETFLAAKKSMLASEALGLRN